MGYLEYLYSAKKYKYLTDFRDKRVFILYLIFVQKPIKTLKVNTLNLYATQHDTQTLKMWKSSAVSTLKSDKFAPLQRSLKAKNLLKRQLGYLSVAFQVFSA